MDTLNIENIYNFLKDLLKEFKSIFFKAKVKNINLVALDHLEIYTRVETALLYKELVIREFDSEQLIRSIYKQIYNHYINMIAQMLRDQILDTELCIKKGHIARYTEEEIPKYTKIYSKLKEKVDYFHINLLFKEISHIKTKECYDLQSQHLVDLELIVNNFPDHNVTSGYNIIISQLGKKLAQLERGDVLNDTIFYTINNIENYLSALTKFEEFFSFFNLLIFMNKDLCEMDKNDNNLFTFATNVFFYSTDMLIKMKKNRNQVDFMEKHEMVEELMKKCEDIQLRIVTFFETEFEYANMKIINTKKRADMIGTIYKQSIEPFFTILIKKLNTVEYERAVVVRGLKFLMRNCKRMQKFLKKLRAEKLFVESNEKFIEQWKTIKGFKRAGTKKSQKKQQQNEEIMIKEDKIEAKPVAIEEKQTIRIKPEASKNTTVSNIMKKMSTLKSKKDKNTHNFKIKEDDKMMYEDEYDDTLDVYANTDMRYRTNDIDDKLKLNEFDEEVEENYMDENVDFDEAPRIQKKGERPSEAKDRSVKGDIGQYREKNSGNRFNKYKNKPHKKRNDEADYDYIEQDRFVKKSKHNDNYEKEHENSGQIYVKRDYKANPNKDQDPNTFRADTRNYKPNTHTAKTKK